MVWGDSVNRTTIKPLRLESLLAGVLNFGTWLASTVIAAGIGLSLFYRGTTFLKGIQVMTAGIGLLILLPILRVIIMLIVFAKERDYKFAVAATVVLLILFAGFAVGSCPPSTRDLWLGACRRQERDALADRSDGNERRWRKEPHAKSASNALRNDLTPTIPSNTTAVL
jgi:uncharacterized membrane protein